MKRTLAAALALILFLAGAQPGFAERWTPPPQKMDHLGVNISENVMESTGGTSRFMVMERMDPGSSGMSNQKLCTDLGPGCEPGESTVPLGNIVLPPCESEASENCIESVLFTNTETGLSVQANLLRSIAGPTIQARPEFGLPYGGTTSLWEAPGFTHDGNAATYAVTANYEIASDKKTYLVSKLNAVINPYTQVSGSYEQISFSEFTEGDLTRVSTRGVNLTCAWNESGSCGRFQDFGQNVRIELSLRTTKQVSGWFKGRLNEASIRSSDITKTQRRLVFAGEPVMVPLFAFSKPRSEATVAELAFMTSKSGWTGGQLGVRSDSLGSVSFLEAFRESSGDTATAVVSTWSVGAIVPGSHPCLRDNSKVHGLVTTNAMIYQTEAPSFRGGTLSYKVAGTHYEPDGKTLARGTYELIVRSDTARCLYGFSKAPVSASVTVSGSEEVATTVVSERGGWLKLTANGFTFSEKTIKVKLTQKKTTITCVTTKKPTKSKKVTGVNPKCPKGYKKR